MTISFKDQLKTIQARTKTEILLLESINDEMPLRQWAAHANIREAARMFRHAAKHLQEAIDSLPKE